MTVLDDPPEQHDDQADDGDREADLRWWRQVQAEEARAEAKRLTPTPPPPDPPASSNGHHADPDPDQPITPEEKIRGSLLYGDAICDVPPPEPLMGGILSLDSVAVLYGRPGGGKSLLALDWALHIATGSWWNGTELDAGNVLYALAEGVRGTGPRVKAWKEHNHYAAPIPDGYVWLPLAFDLRELGWAGALAQVAADLTPRLIVIDTLNRYAPGTDEGPADMGKIIFAADLLKRMTGACVLIVHHSGKDAGQGARGHSSLLGAVDTELELKNGGDGILVLQITKQKDGADGQTYRLTMVPAADSVAIAPYTGAVADGDRISAIGLSMLETLGAIAIPGGVTTSVWQKACGDDVAERSYFRWRSRLLELGEVVNLGTPERPRYSLPGTRKTPESQDF